MNAQSSLFSPHRLQHVLARFNPGCFLVNQQLEDMLARLEVVKKDFKTIGLLAPCALNLPFDFRLIEDVTPDSYDLILAPNLQQAEHLPHVLKSLKQMLAKNGVFIGSLIGGHSLSTLRDTLMTADIGQFGGAYPRLHPLISTQTAANMLQETGFKLPVADSDSLNVHYTGLQMVLNDLRENGDGNALTAYTPRYPGKAYWPLVESLFKQKYGTAEGHLPVSFDFIHLIGWRD